MKKATKLILLLALLAALTGCGDKKEESSASEGKESISSLQSPITDPSASEETKASESAEKPASSEKPASPTEPGDNAELKRHVIGSFAYEAPEKWNIVEEGTTHTAVHISGKNNFFLTITFADLSEAAGGAELSMTEKDKYDILDASVGGMTEDGDMKLTNQKKVTIAGSPAYTFDSTMETDGEIDHGYGMMLFDGKHLLSALMFELEAGGSDKAGFDALIRSIQVAAPGEQSKTTPPAEEKKPESSEPVAGKDVGGDKKEYSIGSLTYQLPSSWEVESGDEQDLLYGTFDDKLVMGLVMSQNLADKDSEDMKALSDAEKEELLQIMLGSMGDESGFGVSNIQKAKFQGYVALKATMTMEVDGKNLNGDGILIFADGDIETIFLFAEQGTLPTGTLDQFLKSFKIHR